MTDEQLDQLLLQSIESAPPSLRQKVNNIPQNHEGQMSWHVADRFDRIFSLVTGLLGIWITGLILLYNNLITTLLSDFFSFSYADVTNAWVLPVLGLLVFLVVFSKYLIPCSLMCED
jgi:uncharacterized BrkB/YihY/UPF0761 family membrane protein